MIISNLHFDINDMILDDIEKHSKSALMQDIFFKILRLSKLESHIILVGEIGSGKKRLAQIIHENSNRADGPFQSFYCVDITENDYKDAFWGQLKFGKTNIELRYDILEKAFNGIIYLDQFSELPYPYMRDILDSYLKGCTQLFRYNKTVQPRLIISLNQESYHKILGTSIWQKMLDELDPVLIMLPPLRERKEDIPVLIDHFINEIKKRSQDFKDLKISSKALFECSNYNWPGNIRQLKNAILQGAVLSYGQTIEREHLPFSMSWKLPYEFGEKKSS